MTGGPYPPHHVSSSEIGANPDPIPPFIRSLVKELQIQLGHELPEPIYWRIWNNEDCIPTLMPGHLERMEEMKTFLTGSGWGGRLAVVGAGVGGVSVGDCVEAGRRVGRDWV
jgi:oxygen-dependent protoporphyrinogen oxidase